MFANQTHSADNFVLAKNNMVLTQFQGIFVDLEKAFYWLVPHDGLISSDYHTVRTSLLPSNAQTLCLCRPLTNILSRFQVASAWTLTPVTLSGLHLSC